MIELTVSHAIANRLKADVGIETLTFAGDLDRLSRQAQRLAKSHIESSKFNGLAHTILCL